MALYHPQLSYQKSVGALVSTSSCCRVSKLVSEDAADLAEAAAKTKVHVV